MNTPRVLRHTFRQLRYLLGGAAVIAALASSCRARDQSNATGDTVGGTVDAPNETAVAAPGETATASRHTPSTDTARIAGLPPRAELQRWAFRLSASPEGDPAKCGLERAPAPRDTGKQVTVYFGCQPSDAPILNAVPARVISVPAGANPMQTAVAALLRGPTPSEARAGYLSGFGDSTARVGFTVHTLGDGLVAVNFDSSLRPNLLSGNMGISQVVRSLAQFRGVRSVAILIGGRHLCSVVGEC